MANWDELPTDVASRILARLPPSSIQQCRRVCRGWRILVDDPHFLTLFKEHHRRRARMPLFFYRRNFNLDDRVPEEHHQGVARMDLQAVDMAASETHPILRFHDVMPPDEDEAGVFAMDVGDIADPDSVFRIQGSCDGLLLLSHGERLYICNPTTGHWTGLPSLNQEQVIVGFYMRDPPADGPKVYRILYAAGVAEEETSYWIRVVGLPVEDEALHEIGRPLSQGMPVALDMILQRGLRPAYQAPPIAIQHTLHWLPPYPVLSNRIIIFDTFQERFGWIRPPGQAPPLGGFQLMQLDGLLAMACRNNARTMLEIWVRHNQGKEDWVLRHRIRFPETAILNNLGYDQLRSPPAYIVSEELDVLFPCPYCLLHCSSDGDVRQHYHRLQHWVIPTPHMFDENFTAHGVFFVPLVNHDGEPPFLFTAVFEDH